jgi:hypothetical protein
VSYLHPPPILSSIPPPICHPPHPLLHPTPWCVFLRRFTLCRWVLRVLPSCLLPPSPTYLYPSHSTSSSISDVFSPVLNLDPSGPPLLSPLLPGLTALNGSRVATTSLSSDKELIKLVATTRTLCPVHFASSTPTYYNPVAKEKWSPLSLLQSGTLRSPLTGVDRRARGTTGGDRLPSSCPPSTHVASLPTVIILFNSVVSDDASFGTIDLTDFYLGTTLPVPQFIKIHVHQFSHDVLSSLSFLPFIKIDGQGKKIYSFQNRQDNVRTQRVR